MSASLVSNSGNSATNRSRSRARMAISRGWNTQRLWAMSSANNSRTASSSRVGVLGIFRPKKTKPSESHASPGLRLLMEFVSFKISVKLLQEKRLLAVLRMPIRFQALRLSLLQIFLNSRTRLKWEDICLMMESPRADQCQGYWDLPYIDQLTAIRLKSKGYF